MEAMMFILAVLATYAFSFALVHLSGPFNAFERLRDTSFMNKFGVLECLACTAFWFSLIFSFAYGLHLWPLAAFAVWGAVILIDRLVTYHLLKSA